MSEQVSYKKLADAVREFIPNGDGYNSDYANTLADASDAIDALQAERDAALAKIENLKFEIEVIRNDELGAAVWAETEDLRFKLSDAMTECEKLRAQLNAKDSGPIISKK